MDEKTLKDLREQRMKAIEEADALMQLSEQEKRGLTPEETEKVTAYLKEADRIKGELEAAARAQQARAAIDEAKRASVPEIARPVVQEGETRETPPRIPQIQVYEHESRAYQKGDAFGAVVTARVKFGGWQQPQAIRWAESMFGSGSPQARALQQSTFTAGGALIAENFVGSEFIELLRATAAVRRAGARQVALVNGSFTTPKVTGGVTGGWIGTEGDNITTSEPTFGQLVLAEKKYGVIVPFSNDLRRNASLDAIRVVRDDLVRATANDEDVAFLKGTGLAGQPKGIYNWIPAAGKTASAGTTLANVRTDIRVARNRLDSNHVPNARRAWFMHSRAMNYMGWDLVDGNSNFAFPSLQNANGATLAGDPVFRDNNISITLGAGTSTEIYYVEMSECFIGDAMDLEIEVFDNAVYSQSGTIRSGISRDESCIRLIRKTDFGMRHDVAAHVLETVAYGA